MSQVTWRAAEKLVDRVRAAARREGCSLNEYLTRLAQAATDPDLAGSDLEKLQERLSSAGLLAPPGTKRRRPDPKAVARARRKAGHGRPLSTLVVQGRG